MCCGRGVWHQEFHTEDELDAHINAMEDENKRLHDSTRWLEFRLMQMNGHLESAREALALARAQADRARAQRDQPRHARWMSSSLLERRPDDASERRPADESVITPCAWHDDADHGNHNVVAGDYKRVETEENLDSLFSHLEVTLFRSDRFGWSNLQDIMRGLFRAE